MNGTIAHTMHRSIFIPEVEVTNPKGWYKYEALRGSSHTLAAFDAGNCIGWVKAETLGYTSAKDWLNSWHSCCNAPADMGHMNGSPHSAENK